MTRSAESHTQDPTLERWFTVAELCERTGFKRSTLYAAIRSGRLRAKAPNGGTRWRRVSETEWLRFLEEEMG